MQKPENAAAQISIDLVGVYAFLSFIGAILAWTLGLLGGFAFTGVVLSIFKTWLSRERQYSEKSFYAISRGALIIPLIFSYIFLPKAGFSGMDLLLSMIIVVYFVGVCFGKPFLLRSFANILISVSYIFISLGYLVRNKLGEGKNDA